MLLNLFYIIILKEKYFYFCFLLVLIIVWFLNNKILKLKFLKKILFIIVGLILLLAFFKSLLNYFSWLSNPVGKKLLPPTTPIFYFLRYSFQHYFFSPFLTIAFAILVFYLILKFNKKFQETFFYEEEPYLATIGILLTRWPNCLIFLILVLFLGIVLHLGFFCFCYLFYNKEKKYDFSNFRLSLINLWLPSALLVMILSDIINKLKIVEYLKV